MLKPDPPLFKSEFEIVCIALSTVAAEVAAFKKPLLHLCSAHLILHLPSPVHRKTVAVAVAVAETVACGGLDKSPLAFIRGHTEGEKKEKKEERQRKKDSNGKPWPNS